MVTTSGLIPMLFALAGVMVTLRYLKGVSESILAIRYLFFGFLFVFFSKLLMFGFGFLGETYYYCAGLACRLMSAVLLVAAACGGVELVRCCFDGRRIGGSAVFGGVDAGICGFGGGFVAAQGIAQRAGICCYGLGVHFSGRVQHYRADVVGTKPVVADF